MTELYVVVVTFDGKEFKLNFSEKKTAEKFVSFTTSILTKKGNKALESGQLKFECVVEEILSEEDMFLQIMKSFDFSEEDIKEMKNEQTEH